MRDFYERITEERKELIRSCGEDLTVREMAEMFGNSTHKMTGILYRFKLPFKRVHAPKDKRRPFNPISRSGQVKGVGLPVSPVVEFKRPKAIYNNIKSNYCDL